MMNKYLKELLSRNARHLIFMATHGTHGSGGIIRVYLQGDNVSSLTQIDTISMDEFCNYIQSLVQSCSENQEHRAWRFLPYVQLQPVLLHIPLMDKAPEQANFSLVSNGSRNMLQSALTYLPEIKPAAVMSEASITGETSAERRSTSSMGRQAAHAAQAHLDDYLTANRVGVCKAKFGGDYWLEQSTNSLLSKPFSFEVPWATCYVEGDR